ncbi:ABC transporter permease [Paenibacillus sp. JCM 10914]
MLKKESMELSRNLKIIIAPLVMILLGLSQPIVLKLLPKLIDSSTLPEGVVFQISEPTAQEVIASTLSKFASMAPIVVCLIVMGTIAGERMSGVVQMVLVKPISRFQYFASKAIAYALLIYLSYLLAMIIAAFYTIVLFGDIHWTHAVVGIAAYLPNLLLVISLTLFASVFLKSSIGAAGIGLLGYYVLGFFPSSSGVNPHAVTSEAMNIVLHGSSQSDFSFIMISLISLIFLISGVFLFKKQEL